MPTYEELDAAQAAADRYLAAKQAQVLYETTADMARAEAVRHPGTTLEEFVRTMDERAAYARQTGEKETLLLACDPA